MYFRFLYLFLIISMMSCVVIPTYIARLSLKSINQNNEGMHMVNVLLIGTGNIGSRVFLDNRSTELIQSFKEKGITSAFSYVGKMAPLSFN